jgi:hypothetical protein
MWPWPKRKPPPKIPPYKVPVQPPIPPREPSIVVEEHDTSKMTETGVFKAWKRLTGKGE